VVNGYLRFMKEGKNSRKNVICLWHTPPVMVPLLHPSHVQSISWLECFIIIVVPIVSVLAVQ
jgi:hypothetical protein